MATGVEGQTRTHGRDLLAQLSSPLRSFLSTESGSAGVLLLATVLATVLALAWANSRWSELYHDLMATGLAFTLADATLSKDLQHRVNDGLMVVFGREAVRA